MKNSIINEIYNGNLDPLETIVPTDPNYRKLSKKLADETDNFIINLDEKGSEQFEKLQDMQRSLSTMSEYATFTYGLKLGVLFMCEIFGMENRPEI